MVQIEENILGACVQIIDLAAKNGTFSGNDLSTVGEVRNKLVEAIKPAIEEEVEAAVDGE
jgi:hypothetical protein